MKTYKCEAFGKNRKIFEIELPDYTDEFKLIFKQPERLNPEDGKSVSDSLNSMET